MPADFRPLTVETKLGSYRTLWTVEDAAAFLLRGWPSADHGSKERQDALRACLLALEGSGDAAAARQCFLEAAEAGMFVRKFTWRRPS